MHFLWKIHYELFNEWISLNNFRIFRFIYLQLTINRTMIQVRRKRVYEDFSETDDYRVLADKLWSRPVYNHARILRDYLEMRLKE